MGATTRERLDGNRGKPDTNERLITDGSKKYPVRSPLWWVSRLYAQLNDRVEKMSVYDDYYIGDFPLPWLAPQAEEEFRRILRMSRANYTGLVIDSMVERMAVEGFRVDEGKPMKTGPLPGVPGAPGGPGGDLGMASQQVTGALGAAAQGKAIKPERLAEGAAHGITPEGKVKPPPVAETKAPPGAAFGAGALPPGALGVTKGSNYKTTTIGEADREMWRIWQANGMDSLFDQALLEAAINGVSYLMIGPNDDDPKTPKIWVEHPSQCIIEHVPGSQRREVAAGLKVWDDDIEDRTCATLYLPGEIHKFQTKRRKGQVVSNPKWEPRSVDGEEWPAQIDMDIVPIFELPNNPRLLTGGRSEIADVLDTQDRIVKTIADRLMTQDYGAFPQRWARGWPEEDSSGRPTKPIDVGRDRMITTDVAEAQFGQFSAADLGGYMAGKKEDVTDMAARTRTPAQYLLGEFSNVNGETLKASESGHVAKVRQRIRGIDDELERAMLEIRKLAGLPHTEHMTLEVVWRNPEFRTEGELVDALAKMGTLGVPQEALWERWGATPPEIQRWKVMERERAEAQAEQDSMALLADTYRASAAVVQDAKVPRSGGGANNAPNPAPAPKPAGVSIGPGAVR